jgi:hypothetical protein
VGLVVKDSPRRKALDQALRAPGLSITVGVHAAEGAELRNGSALGETVADIASEHELGLGVPERSFVRAYCDATALGIEADLRQGAKRAVSGGLTWAKAAELIGQKHAAGMQKYIADGKVSPPLSPITIAKKGSSTPLIDTGQLRSAITYTVDGGAT